MNCNNCSRLIVGDDLISLAFGVALVEVRKSVGDFLIYSPKNRLGLEVLDDLKDYLAKHRIKLKVQTQNGRFEFLEDSSVSKAYFESSCGKRKRFNIERLYPWDNEALTCIINLSSLPSALKDKICSSISERERKRKERLFDLPVWCPEHNPGCDPNRCTDPDCEYVRLTERP